MKLSTYTTPNIPRNPKSKSSSKRSKTEAIDKHVETTSLSYFAKGSFGKNNRLFFDLIIAQAHIII